MSARETVGYRFGPWEIDGLIADGARIGRLRYQGIDLLTQAPEEFRAPLGDYGAYETRPVYGYDDCFPTVDACGPWPDHGELCWLPWSGSVVDCSVASRIAALRFSRRLECGPSRLRWHFVVQNEGPSPQPFQHVMHALMPITLIESIDLPFGGGYDAAAVVKELTSLPSGVARMFFLRDVSVGIVGLKLRGGLKLSLNFPTRLFPTLGVWWNRDGYPGEPGLARSECAFEPVPGADSTLAHGTTMVAPGFGELAWWVDWEIACH